MTLWLANLAAYSVQLAALVGTGAVIVAILRLNVPRATLWFWQIVFASSLLWPAYQLWANADASGFASGRLLGEVFAGGVLWSVASSSAAGMRAGIAAMDPGVTTLVIAVLASGTAIRLGWLGLGLMRLRSI